MPNGNVCEFSAEAGDDVWQEFKDDDGDSYFVKGE